jgi:uncharacterized protein YyaL (SSP411 family)
MNQLSQSRSAYLRQHANNPVDWMPWGEEALQKAVTEKKLLFVSIGYSSCHWCHVMEHESFEDPAVAALLREHFVAIKVDREEHPDVDQFFMDALHTMVSRGGWPLNIFATPDRKPFFGGTYFPNAQFQMLIQNITQVWEQNPAQIVDQADKVLEHIKTGSVFSLEESKLAQAPKDFALLASQTREAYQKLAEHKLRSFDPVWGGFGSAPKFPRSHSISALLNSEDFVSDAGKKKSILHAVGHSLRGMCFGGLWDHVGGGFHRYSTDEQWLVPHFEKMLYDQALLLKTMSEAYLRTREPFLKMRVAELRTYLERDMRLSNGALAAATDADSEGVEGKYFVWNWDELESVLKDFPKEERELFYRTYNIREKGNWEENNIPHLSLSLDWEEFSKHDFSAIQSRLLEVRSQRVPPLRDEKGIVSWNAWMASAFFEASYAILDTPELSNQLQESGEKSMEFLDRAFSKGLPRIVYGEEHYESATLEDIAAYLEALQSAQRVLGESEGRARRLREVFAELKNYRDASGKLQSRKRGGGGGPELPFEALADEDGASPSAYSTYLACVLREYAMGGLGSWQSSEEFRKVLFEDLKVAALIQSHNPQILSYLLSAMEFVCAEGVLKVARSEYHSVLEILSLKGLRLSQFVLLPSKDTFQICDLESCHVNTKDPAEFWQKICLPRAGNL